MSTEFWAIVGLGVTIISVGIGIIRFSWRWFEILHRQITNLEARIGGLEGRIGKLEGNVEILIKMSAVGQVYAPPDAAELNRRLQRMEEEYSARVTALERNQRRVADDPRLEHDPEGSEGSQ